jgi:nickel-dependent lactate racemase
MPSNDNPRTIKYGDKTIPLALPPGAIESWLEPVCPPPPSDPASLIRHALNHPFGGVSLQALAKGKRSAAILIPGKDRIAGISTLLPLLLQELNDAGIPDEAITVTIARGTHVRHSPHDIATIMGPEATSRVQWQEHRPPQPPNPGGLAQ